MTRSSAPSQVERVLAFLRSRGSQGLNTSEMQELPIADGGSPVLRLAARVCQLREAGYSISSRREKNGTSTYVLESQGYGGGWSGAKPQPDKAAAPERLVGEPERASGELGETEAAGIGSSRGGRSARERALSAPSSASSESVTPAPAESPLFDSSVFARGDYRDAERAA